MRPCIRPIFAIFHKACSNEPDIGTGIGENASHSGTSSLFSLSSMFELAIFLESDTGKEENRHDIGVHLKDGWSRYKIAKHLNRPFNIGSIARTSRTPCSFIPQAT